MAAPTPPQILIIDDDPFHLEIYGMLVQQAGYAAVPVLVRFSGLDPVPETAIDAILLDYRLNSVRTSPEIAQELSSKYPRCPIVVLSDLWNMPGDIAPYASCFVRKGEPKNLLRTLQSILMRESKADTVLPSSD